MDHIKKIGSKVFKKSTKPKRDPKLRHSRSMPMRNSSETDDSYHRPRPIYRGEHPLKISDIHPIIDISPEAGARQESQSHGWPCSQNKEYSGDGNDPSDGDSYYRQRRPLIDRNVVDQFPAPPTTTPRAAGTRTPTRPEKRPPTLHMDDLDLLPELDPGLKAKMDAMYAANVASHRLDRGAHEVGLQARQQATRAPPRRSNSNASSQIRPPPSGYYIDRKVNPPSTTASRGGAGVYSSSSNNLSTHSLNPNAHFRNLDQPQLAAAGRRRNDSSASSAKGVPFYSNPTSNLSTRSLGPNAQFRPGPGFITNASTHPPLPRKASIPTVIDPQLSAAGRRRNESSASLSAHKGTAARVEQAYHPDVRRLMRGPHSAKLQCPTPVRPERFDLALEVNDAEVGEWGVSPARLQGSGARMPATIAGQGRAGYRH